MKDKNIVFFDGLCNLCNSSIQFILKNEKREVLLFSSLQSDFAKDFLKDDYHLNTIVFSENGQIYKESKAVIKIANFLKFPFSLIQYLRFVPSFIANTIYRVISKKRYFIFGKRESCYIPKGKQKRRFLD